MSEFFKWLDSGTISATIFLVACSILLFIALFTLSVLVFNLVRNGKITIWGSDVVIRGAAEQVNKNLISGKLDGRWYVFYSHDTSQSVHEAVGVADINHNGDKFRMSIHLTKSKYGNNIDNIFEYSGHMLGSQIVAEYKSTRPHGSQMEGAIVMRCNPAGDKLHGAAIYVNIFNKISRDDFWLQRDRNFS